MKFKNPIHLGKKDFICFNVSSDRMKFSHIKVYPTKKEICSLKTLISDGLSDEEISKFISAYIKETKIRGIQLINVLPAHLAIIKNIEVPSQNLQEIKEIIDLQVGRYTPYSREEIIIDYINLGSYRKNYTKILLVIVTKSNIRKLFDISEKAGMKVEKISFISEAIAIFLSRISNVKDTQLPVSFLYINSKFTDYMVELKGKLLFIRSIPIGIQHLISEKERYQGRFVEEVKKSIEFYQTEDIDRMPGELIISGAQEITNEFTGLIRNSLNLPCRSVDYFEQLPVSENLRAEIMAAKDFSYLDVIAPLLQSDDLKINLIPEEIKLKRAFEERGRELVKTGVLLMVVFTFILGILINNIYFKDIYLKKLSSKYQPIIEEAKGLEVTFSRIKTIRHFLKNRGWPIEVLGELYTLIPGDIYLNDIKLAHEGRLSVGGKSKSMSAVFSLVSSMEDSKLFRNVKTKRTTKMKEGDIELVYFEIMCILEKQQM